VQTLCKTLKQEKFSKESLKKEKKEKKKEITEGKIYSQVGNLAERANYATQCGTSHVEQKRDSPGLGRFSS